ncbi:DUF1190 domain-containing protein [Methylocystis sp. SC2]|uniref:DUF1190 domain-containing protein n=1 Tax=Methylocystis sp. (strain SC2) TaxID=187303 RepID=UPI001FCC3345|nr:DUF1190 domain-containing protein [Methylocystis sp. SC2]
MRAETMEKTYFFATRDACMTSGAFTPQECAAAFANARAQLRDKAPRYFERGECHLHFRLCEPIQAGASIEEPLSDEPADRPAFAPSALGVEIIAAPGGVEAAPTLAVDTPQRLFAYFPVSRSYEAEIEDKELRESAAILAPDHFVLFSKHKAFTGEVRFAAAALGTIEGPTGAQTSATETREQRRLRLKNAPFIP